MGHHVVRLFITGAILCIICLALNVWHGGLGALVCRRRRVVCWSASLDVVLSFGVLQHQHLVQDHHALGDRCSRPRVGLAHRFQPSVDLLHIGLRRFAAYLARWLCSDASDVCWECVLFLLCEHYSTVERLGACSVTCSSRGLLAGGLLVFL